jgi:glycosyltransferase involved in cell wall biosynthesis
MEVPASFLTEHQRELKRGEPLEGVNILSHFCNPSGIQQAALWAKAALERAGLRTSCRDVPVPRRVVPNDREQWLGQEIFPITILTQAATPYFESGYERSGLWPRENGYRIAYWNWELETVPDEWVEAAGLVDEIWSPTRFVADAMSARMPCPVYHILPGVEVGPVEKVTRSSLNIPEDHFVFLFMFDLHSQVHRKNPGAVFRAFRETFREDDKATLVIKTTGGDIHSADLEQVRKTIGGPNITLLDKLMPRAQAYGLIAMADCFVSLHRSEGFGLGLAEAMLMAKPVIATGYSGNLDFMNRNNSLLVDYELVEIKEDRPIYTRGNFWAEPSIKQAAAYMRDVYEHRDEACARALRGQAETQSLLSLEAAGQRMRARLEQIVAA